MLPVLKMAVGWHEIAEVKGAEERAESRMQFRVKDKKRLREIDKATLTEKENENWREEGRGGKRMRDRVKERERVSAKRTIF